MTAPTDHVATSDDSRRAWEDWLAGPMFFLGVLFLVVLAGLIHRYPQLERTDLEAYLIEGALGVLWLVFVLEAVVRFALRDRSRPLWRALIAALAGGLLPPLRLGCRSQVLANHIWLPWKGWEEINNVLRRGLERAFSVPMIFFALMVLPLLALEYYVGDRIRQEPVLALWLDIGTSVIWIAFAIELILMVAVSDRPWSYCGLHWIDVTIVLLPFVDVLPVLRLLRLGRVLRAEQLLRWGRLYRLKALLGRGWRAFVLLQVVQRLTGRSPERQFKRLQELVHAKEDELADLRLELTDLERRIAQKAVARLPDVTPAPPTEWPGVPAT